MRVKKYLPCILWVGKTLILWLGKENLGGWLHYWWLKDLQGWRYDNMVGFCQKSQSMFPATRRALASPGDRGMFSLLCIPSLLLSSLDYFSVESGTGRVLEGQSRQKGWEHDSNWDMPICISPQVLCIRNLKLPKSNTVIGVNPTQPNPTPTILCNRL